MPNDKYVSRPGEMQKVTDPAAQRAMQEKIARFKAERRGNPKK